MRLSTRGEEVGFTAYRMAIANGKAIRIYLGDVEMKQCTMADDENGEVRRCVLSPNGYIVDDGNGNVLEETLFGDVRIEITDGPVS